MRPPVTSTYATAYPQSSRSTLAPSPYEPADREHGHQRHRSGGDGANGEEDARPRDARTAEELAERRGEDAAEDDLLDRGGQDDGDGQGKGGGLSEPLECSAASQGERPQSERDAGEGDSELDGTLSVRSPSSGMRKSRVRAAVRTPTSAASASTAMRAAAGRDSKDRAVATRPTEGRSANGAAPGTSTPTPARIMNGVSWWEGTVAANRATMMSTSATRWRSEPSGRMAGGVGRGPSHARIRPWSPSRRIRVGAPGSDGGEPAQEHGDDHQEGEVGERLRGEVVLPDPVSEVEDRNRRPHDALVARDSTEDHQQRPEVEQVEEDRRPVGEAERAPQAHRLGGEGGEDEESRPVEVGVDRSVDLAVRAMYSAIPVWRQATRWRGTSSTRVGSP